MISTAQSFWTFVSCFRGAKVFKALSCTILLLTCLQSNARAQTCEDLFQARRPANPRQQSHRIPTLWFSPETGYPAYLNDPANVGKMVDVAFPVNQYGTPLESPDIIRQRISSVTEMDDATKLLIQDLKRSSGSGGDFRESSAWLIYTSRDVYRSEIGTGGHYSISTATSTKLVRALLAKIRTIEGVVRIEDIEFFHTHLEAGEAFNRGDVDSHVSFLMDIRWRLEADGTALRDEQFVSHAVPINGRVFYSYRGP